MTLKQRNRVSAYGAVIAVCALSALASAGHSADAPPPELPPGQPTGLPCGYEVAGIIQGPPQPALGTFVTGLNEHGWVSGYWHGLGAGSDRAYYWKPAFGESVFTIPLPTGYSRSFALDINDNGLVVGHMSGAGNPSRGFVYDTNTNEMVAILDPIDPAGFNAKCWANAINNDGVVVGARSLGETEQPYNAFIWTPNEDDPSEGTYTDLGVMNGPNSSSRDINSVGEVIGWHGPSGINAESFHYLRGELTLIEPIDGANSIQASTINNKGEICGSIRLLEGNVLHWQLGFVLGSRSFTYIEPLPEFPTVTAGSINDSGTVTGRLPAPGAAQTTGFVWQKGHMSVLNDSLVTTEAIDVRRGNGINGSGQIIGAGVHNGKNVGFLLNPITALPGDLTNDCTVDADDLAVLLREWHQVPSAADLNGDGIVNGADLAILLGNWSQ